MPDFSLAHEPLKLFVTGGAGFIGSNFIHYWLRRYPQDMIVNFDKLTYAGTTTSLTDIETQSNYHFVQGDILNSEQVASAIAGCDMVVHFAAETHVDRSISGPGIFLQTNVIGTQVLLDAALKARVQRFHHISTDEVFGSLELHTLEKFNEETPYRPRSPYSASKAASDHLVRAYGETYGLHYTISNCSNNYGPYHFPEKLFPLVITNALDDLSVPVYGDGQNVRDWLYVEDHCSAIERILLLSEDNQTYTVGGLKDDVANIEVVKMILQMLQKPTSLIRFVDDRKGHDRRYAVDWTKIHHDLAWVPSVTLEEGIVKTIQWYKENRTWWEPLKRKEREYFQEQYQTRF